MEEKERITTLELEKGYAFRVRFDQDAFPDLLVDEPPPVGEGRGPSPTQLLSAAVGSCLSASALFCLRKARIDVRGMRTSVQTSVARNEEGRLRIGGIEVRIHLDVDPADRDKIGRCLALFEEFCTVTQSVRRGIGVEVKVDAGGA